MLSLGKLAPGQQRYYLDTVARGAEEYYTGTREAPGVWTGRGAARLGLDGEVDAEALGRVLNHTDPTGTYRLTASRSVPVVAGFDATFCAPKSVSLLQALGSPEVSNEARNAHDAAVASALAVLEQVAGRVRRGHGGHEVLDADGFVAAAFRHRTSRAADPHLHTHVVIANLAHNPDDDRWTALDARPLYGWLATVGHLYEAQLRWELTHRLGVAWGSIRNGIADIDGIPAPVLREFSTRRRQIEEHLAASGQTSARAAQLAAYATRTGKADHDAGDLLSAWWQRASALGFSADDLAAVLGRTHATEPPVPGSPAAEALWHALAGPDGLTAKASTFDVRDVIKAICNALPDGGHVDDVLDLAHAFLASEHVLGLPDATTTGIQCDDGVIVPGGSVEVRYTTPELVALETELVEQALARRGTATTIAPAHIVATALTARPTITPAQADMVRTICGSGDGIDVVEGVAGAGKTFALGAVCDAWTSSGHRVIGCALAARAAKQLGDETGIDTSTIARLLLDIERRQVVLDARTVVIVDEAAMVGTRMLARLLDHANEADSKLVLVGDPCQLPEIDAGGTFRGLQDRIGASHLTDNRRQHDKWERAALAELRAGDVDTALDRYDAHDRVHVGASSDATRDALVDGWSGALFAGEDALMLASRLADVDDLNRRARHALRDAGRLGPDVVVLDGRGFATGDRVLALRNDPRIGVLNGTRATLTAIDTVRRRFILDADGSAFVVPFTYTEDGHLAHGYATTIHKAQGATVDRCFVLADETTTRAHAYTALSRGRHGNVLYVTATDRRLDDRHAHEIVPEPLDDLRRALQHVDSKRLAIDHGWPALRRVGALELERHRLLRQLPDRPHDPTADLRRLDQEIDRHRHALDAARRRLADAQDELQDLGPIGRLTRRADGRDARARAIAAIDAVERHQRELSRLVSSRDALGPAADAWRGWCSENGMTLARLASIDRELATERRTKQALNRSAAADTDLGMEP